MRIISLVPSVTDALAALGVADQVIGVTAYCVSGAPDDALRLGGTKNPEVDRVVALRPDLVIVNTEENKPEHIQLLREAGLTVEETHPTTVGDAATLMRRLGEATGTAERGEAIARDIEQALADARARAPAPRVMALILVWRKPWMGAGPDTYASSLLEECGFGNVLTGYAEDYPRLQPGTRLGADVVILPSEPYEFTSEDLPAVAELVGEEVRCEFVDGQLLTWHGPRTAAALHTFSALARSSGD